jgi:hypothetical protein
MYLQLEYVFTIRKGRSPFASANYYQDQVQIPQSVSVVSDSCAEDKLKWSLLLRDAAASTEQHGCLENFKWTKQ